MKIISLLVTLLFCVSAISGQEVGGGVAMKCQSSPGALSSTHTLLDFSEAGGRGYHIQSWDRKWAKKTKRWTISDFTEMYLSRLDKVTTDEAYAEIKATVDQLNADMKIFTYKSLYEFQMNFSYEDASKSNLVKFEVANFGLTPDLSIARVPLNCQLVQAAIQGVVELPGDKLFHLSAEIWYEFDNAERAGLLMHEAIYNYARKYGQTNSRKTRYIVGLLNTFEYEQMSPLELQEKVVNVMKLPGFQLRQQL